MDVGSGYIMDHKASIKHLAKAKQVCFNMPQEHVLPLARTWVCMGCCTHGLDHPYSLLPAYPKEMLAGFSCCRTDRIIKFGTDH